MGEDKSAQIRWCLEQMARGEDVWEEFLQLNGRFILHILVNDFDFFENFDQHSRKEILHDIYLKIKRNAAKLAPSVDEPRFTGYLRKTVKSVMSDRLRVVQRLSFQVVLEPMDGSSEEIVDVDRLDPLSRIEELWRGQAASRAVKASIVIEADNSRNSKQTKMILEHYLLKGKDYSYIADNAGLSIDAIRHIVHYYRKRVIKRAQESLGLKPGKGGCRDTQSTGS